MISLRQHIVSIVAVFLALGLGIVLGSSVVSTPVEARLNADLERYKGQLDEARAAASEVGGENDALRDRMAEQVAPWAVHTRLADMPFVFVSDSPDVPKWREHVLDALVDAGAEPQGSILLSDRWQLSAPDDADDLISTMRSVVPTFAPGDEPAQAALELVGERFSEPTGRALIDVLTRDGFMTVQGRPDGDWPPSAASVVMLSAMRTEEDTETAGDAETEVPPPAALSFARKVAEVTPTLVVTDEPGDASVVGQLRDVGDLAERLATFDSATSEDDPGGVGVVAAMLAATEGRGGHYGAQRGLTFVAPAGSND